MANRGEIGMTLVEMLVVLTIVAIMAGMMVLGMGSSADRTAEIEAKRLAARLTLAADEAMIADKPVALAWDKGGYRFLIQEAGTWRVDPVSALEPHTLPHGVALEAKAASPLLIGGGSPADLRFMAANGAWSVSFDGATARVSVG